MKNIRVSRILIGGAAAVLAVLGLSASPAAASPMPTATLTEPGSGPYCSTLSVYGSGFAGPGFVQVDLWHTGASAPDMTVWTWIAGDGSGRFEGGPITLTPQANPDGYAELFWAEPHTQGWSSYALSNYVYCIPG